MLTKEAIIEILNESSDEAAGQFPNTLSITQYVRQSRQLTFEIAADRLLEAAKGETARSGVPVVDTAWISVEKELPEDDQCVLAFCQEDKCTYTAYYNPDIRWKHFYLGHPLFFVQYWMPLPQPPKQ